MTSETHGSPAEVCVATPTTYPLQEEEREHSAKGEEASHYHHDDGHSQVLVHDGQGCDPTTVGTGKEDRVGTGPRRGLLPTLPTYLPFPQSPGTVSTLLHLRRS